LDLVSDQGLTLPTPEPQYLYAQMAMAGRMSLAALDARAPTVQQWVSMQGGGNNVDPEADRLARVADVMPGAVTAVDAFGIGRGDTVKFQRPVYSTGGLTEADRQLTTGTTISTTGLDITNEEIPVVLKEFHGPYDASGSAVAPYEIWDFDAKYRANKLSLASQVTQRLVRDYTKWLDTVIRLRYEASGYTTLSDPDASDVTDYVAGGGQLFSVEQVLRARKTLSDREWAPFPSGRYTCIVPTSFNLHMIEDVDYTQLSKNHDDERNLIFGYIGSIQDVDLYECTTNRTWAAASTATGDAGGTVPTGVTIDEAIMFGPGAVGFATGLAPECRWADATNYGTVAKCIWYALHGFQTLDNRGVQRLMAQTT
jgi:hypothetical protein